MPPRKKVAQPSSLKLSDFAKDEVERCRYRFEIGGAYSPCGGDHPTSVHEQDVAVRRASGFEDTDVDELESRLIEYTARDLKAMGKLETMLGQQLLAIARGIVRGSGSELATLSKEHSRLMAAIAAGQVVAGAPDNGGDALDAAERSVEEKRRLAAQAGGGGS
jgi:hypothetical protein